MSGDVDVTNETFSFLAASHSLLRRSHSFSASQQVEALFRLLRARTRNRLQIDLIFFAGDLAQCGAEYGKQAELFLDNLLDAAGLVSRFGPKQARERLFLVPGNHDVNREAAAFLQRTLRSRGEASAFFASKSAGQRVPHFSRFAKYARFHNAYYRHIRKFSAMEHWLSELVNVRVNNLDVSVGVVGLNTAWFSQDDSDAGQLWIGEPSCSMAFKRLETLGNADLVLMLQHHPLSWLHPDEAGFIESLASRHVDVQIFGHPSDHDGSQQGTQYSEIVKLHSGSLNVLANGVPSFKIGVVNAGRGVLRVLHYVYDQTSNEWELDKALGDASCEYELAKLRRAMPVATVSNAAPNQSFQDRRREYLARLEERLERTKVESFINLRLSVTRRLAPTESASDRIGEPESLTIFGIANSRRTRPVAILGEPGAGKTTVLAELVRSRIAADDQIPVYVALAALSAKKTLMSLLDMREFEDEEVKQLLDAGQLLVVWDGVNEAPGRDTDSVFSAILEFTDAYPRNQYFLSCRSAEFRPWVRERVSEFHMLPIERTEIEQQFAGVLGATRGRELLRQMNSNPILKRILDLCRNPLLLSMVLALAGQELTTSFRDGGSSGNQSDSLLGKIDSKAQLYARFLQKFTHREDTKGAPADSLRVLPVALREALLALLAFKMQEQNLVFAPESTCQSWLADEFKSGSWNIWGNDVMAHGIPGLFRDVAGRPPATSIEVSRDEPLQFAFMHQSFGEYFAALHFKNCLVKGEVEYSKLDQFILDPSRGQWEVLGFLAGLVVDAGDLTRYISKVALREKKQSILVLAGQCVRDAGRIRPEDADDIRLRMIEAYKYWQMPFDYELIHTLRDTLSRHGSRLPKRLEEDVRRFAEKYSHVRPIELREVSTKALCELVMGDDVPLATDAAYTLGGREYKADDERMRIVEFIVQAIGTVSEPVKEQLLASLKYLKDETTIETLLAVANDKNQGARSRAFSLNALGQLASLAAAEPIIQYLTDHSNPHRDSAAWALQLIARKAEATAPTLTHRIKKVFIEALLHETDDGEGKYSKGLILYSLSSLGAKEYCHDIERYIRTVNDPYVLEDAINSLGHIGDEDTGKKIIEFLGSMDPMVRMKTAEALGRLGCGAALQRLTELLNDPYGIVRDAAKLAIEELSRLGRRNM